MRLGIVMAIIWLTDLNKCHKQRLGYSCKHQYHGNILECDGSDRLANV